MLVARGRETGHILDLCRIHRKYSSNMKDVLKYCSKDILKVDCFFELENGLKI